MRIDSILNFLFIFLIFSHVISIPIKAESSAAVDQKVKAEATRSQFRKTVEKSYLDAKKWFLNNIRDEGVFVYLYDPVNDRYASENNMVRQLMASRLLAEITLEQPDLRSTHEKNLQFVFSRWYRESKDGYGYIFYDNLSKLGANAMALRTLVYSPFFYDYADKAKNIARGIISLMNDDGSFEPWFIAPAYQYNPDDILTSFAGEAILSLVEYALKSEQDKYLMAAIRSQEFYLNKYIIHLEQNYYPAYVPWHTMALSKLYGLTNRDEYARAIFRFNDELLKLQDTTDYIGRFHKPEYPHFGKPNSAADGIYTESLAYALEIAKQKNAFLHQASYESAIRLSLQNLLSLQYTKEYSIVAKRKQKMEGAFRINAQDQRIRIDCTQQIVDAYRKILQVF